jgi:ABC-2 type transport system ATP-binding protein
MLVQEYLRFVAEMRGIDRGEVDRRILQAAGQCAVDDVMTRTVGHLSKGYRQRLGLAAAILHDPEILILDEPTGGLDPNQIIEVRELIRRMGRTKTIILSTHILPEVEASCGRAVILIDGRVRADGALGELTRSLVQVATLRTDQVEQAGELLRGLDNVAVVDSSPADEGFRTFRLQLERDEETGEAVAEIARRQGWAIRELRRDDKSLERVFRELTETVEEVPA